MGKPVLSAQKQLVPAGIDGLSGPALHTFQEGAGLALRCAAALPSPEGYGAALARRDARHPGLKGPCDKTGAENTMGIEPITIECESIALPE